MKTIDVQALYAMELRLIKKHFPGLKPRPVKIDNAIKEYGQADDATLILNLDLHRSKREIEATLKHELIHYELKDSKEFHGHGRAFMRRAKQLGILGSIELSQCVTLEEDQYVPHKVEYVRTPLPAFAAGIDKEFAELKELAARLPMNVRLQFYRKVRSIEVNWICYAQAIKNKQDYVDGEIWKRRKGPRGKPLHQLLTEHEALSEQFRKLQEKFFDTRHRAAWKEMQRIERKSDAIEKKLRRDYDMDPY
jgi:hypothetical protein